MKVQKRNGQLEELSVDKLNAVVIAACNGLDANPSDIIMNAKLQLFEGIKTTKIHELLVKSATDLISEDMPDYQYAASRLFSFFTRKQIFGTYKAEEFPTVYELVMDNIKRGLYDKTLLEKWSIDDWNKIDNIVDHDNDDKLTIASYLKLYETYLAKDRETEYVYETPQFGFIIVSLALFDTIDEVKSHYKQLVQRRISWPTPIMAGMRTKTKQYASCTLIETKDTIDSLYATGHAIGRFVSRKAGIGTKMEFRGLGDPIRGGEATHTGNIQFLKHIQSATKAVSQGGLREGSSTVTYDIFHPEIMDILVLKNNKGTEDTRVKSLDYCIRVSKLFLTRMLKNKPISLFSTLYAPQLYDNMGLPVFDEMYLAAEASDIPRKVVNGQELLASLVTERIQTGRIYIQFADNVNGDYNAFIDAIKMTNLCFSGDTLVAVADGRNAISIEQLAKESNGVNKFPVYCAEANEHTWLTEIKGAVAFKSGTKEVITIKLSDGSSFRCTPDHELATSISGKYVEANDSLSVELESIQVGTNITVIDIEYNDEVIDVYDLTVEDNHNFYIITDTNDKEFLNSSAVLVHNCVEITLPTTPFDSIDSKDGEIALCMLAGHNMEHYTNGYNGLEEASNIIVRGLDNIMDIQEYPVVSAEKQLKRRSIGIGVTNFAYWMAKKGFKYDDHKALAEVDEFFEHMQFYALKASMNLAKERGQCEWFNKTKYAHGWLPIDKKNDAVRELTGNREYSLDWEWLRGEIAKYGLRNSVLTALMPVESSSLVTNSTNGIDAPQALVSYKRNKTLTTKFVVPGIKKLKNKYTLAWDIESNDCINKLTGVMQYWIDQAISINHYYNPTKYENNKIPINVVVKDIIQAYKLGNKNLYYARMMDTIQKDELSDSGCAGGACTL